MVIRFGNYVSFNQKLNIFLRDDIKTIPIDIVFQSNIYSFWKLHNLQSKIENIFEGDYENDVKVLSELSASYFNKKIIVGDDFAVIF